MAPSATLIYDQAFDQGLRPDPLLTVSEWADQHRRLSGKAASEPGPWRTNRTPYLREIMDCLSPASSPAAATSSRAEVVRPTRHSLGAGGWRADRGGVEGWTGVDGFGWI